MALSGLAAGCVERPVAPRRPETQDEAEQYVRRAVRESSDGMIIFERNPTVRGVDRDRLREIAHELRQPAARCFLERAIESMQLAEADDDRGYAGVPAGQAKFRVRLRPDGVVATSSVLESGFDDSSMETCVQKAIDRKRFPANDGGTLHTVDIVYWVSLGFHKEARSPAFRDHIRRSSVRAAMAGARCFYGRRVLAGEYALAGLNLFSRTGHTLTNRIDNEKLPPEVVSCLATAFRSIRIDPDPESFVRPAFFEVRVDVDDRGRPNIPDAAWLRLVELEQAAERQERLESLTGPVEGDDDPSKVATSPQPSTPTSPANDPVTIPSEHRSGTLQLAPRGVAGPVPPPDEPQSSREAGVEPPPENPAHPQ